MKKSLWIEAVEWCVLGLIVLFVTGVVVMRGEITSADDGSIAPVQTLGEP
jgi:hypothetical protein